jgi:hypothetical protein
MSTSLDIPNGRSPKCRFVMKCANPALTDSIAVVLYRPFGSHDLGECTMSKVTLVVLSDPQGGEEALGRLFNALAAAYDFKQRRQDVQLVFQGAGARWPAVVTRPEHPAYALFQSVADRVLGVSSGCADVFGARAGAEAQGLALIGENLVPGTSGLPSLAAHAAEGTVITF